MQKAHIPYLKSIGEFFEVYRMPPPLHNEIMCMRLEDQPEDRLLYMPLYRANFFRILHFSSANIEMLVGEKRQEIKENSLVFSFPSKLESWERKGKLFGNVIYFSADFAKIDITNRNFREEYPFFDTEAENSISLLPEESILLKNISDEMITEMYSRNDDKFELIKKLLQLYLHKIRRIYNQKIANFPSEIKADKQTFYRFRKEIDTYFEQLSNRQKTVTPSVSNIAEVLAVNPNYLNAVIKKQTGKTASSYIQDKMILEIKSFLIHTNLQVAEIAYQTGFENVPYFNRFFKKHTKKTPIEFRKAFKL